MWHMNIDHVAAVGHQRLDARPCQRHRHAAPDEHLDRLDSVEVGHPCRWQQLHIRARTAVNRWRARCVRQTVDQLAGLLSGPVQGVE
jgi:hypothetical protein